MAAGNVPDGIAHSHYGKAEGECYGEDLSGSAAASVKYSCTAAHQNQYHCADEFGEILLTLH
jgi:hypothetical protein